MAVSIALWSIALQPGKKETIALPSDLRITNAALGDKLADESGRTSVKFTFPIPIVTGEDEDIPTSTTVLCSLTPGKIEQTTLDVVLEGDDQYFFEVVGKNTVYLTGNYIDQQSGDQVPYNSEDESDEEGYDLRDVSSDVEINPDELDDDDDEGRFEEITEEVITSKTSLKRPHEGDSMEVDASPDGKLTKSAKKKMNKKLKAEGGEAVPAGTEDEKKKTPSKVNGAASGTEQQKTPAQKTQSKANADASGSEQKKDKKDKKDKKKEGKEGAMRELADGLKVQDVKPGTGQQAKKGQTVLMRYIGKLQDGTIFDSNTKGKPFTFTLGAGEVIKGWDEGIVGMHIGGERLLIVPPKLGYGKRKTAGIPPDSVLRFECKLVDIK